jgi:hypothetical protein
MKELLREEVVRCLRSIQERDQATQERGKSAFYGPPEVKPRD